MSIATALPASGGGLPSLSDIPNLIQGFLQPAHPEHLFLLFVYAGGALAISFLCSLLEATLLSVRVAELIRRAESGDRGTNLLLMYKQENVEKGIGAILTLNTIAHTIGASLAGAQAARAFSSDTLPEDVAVAGFSAILTLAVLIATEIIPKTLGTNYASQLAPFVGHTIHILATILSLPLWLMSLLTNMLSHGEPEGISRGELQILVNMAQQHGAIEREESKVLSNMLEFDALVVSDVMTPRIVVAMLPSEATVQSFLEDDTLHVYSRLPIHEGTRDAVIGYVHQRDLLLAAAKHGASDKLVTDYMRDIPTFPEDTPLGDALRTFLDKGEHLAVAQDEFGGTSGIVTLEDVIETMLGSEIVDEVDQVADLRRFASELLEKRLAKRDAQLAELRKRDTGETAGDA